MKKTIKAIEYWFESIPRSSVMPAILALPMLVRYADGQPIGIMFPAEEVNEHPCS
jgi:hypothetical protein